MTAQSWIGIAGLAVTVITYIIVGQFKDRLTRIERQIDKIEDRVEKLYERRQSNSGRM